jgi:hypothetical protein
VGGQDGFELRDERLVALEVGSAVGNTDWVNDGTEEDSVDGTAVFRSYYDYAMIYNKSYGLKYTNNMSLFDRQLKELQVNYSYPVSNISAYCGGGGGDGTAVPASGGSSVGGNGRNGAVGENATANTGSGGGGGGTLQNGGNGSNGIIIVRYLAN